MRLPGSRHPAAVSLAPTSAADAPAFLVRLRDALREWLLKRAVLAELRRLDDRTLADLRIHPGDFQGIADGTYIRDAAHDIARKPATEGSKSRRIARPYY